ncbi:hypothetical protein DNTS_017133, partial [Danionella cerebrum]
MLLTWVLQLLEGRVGKFKAFCRRRLHLLMLAFTSRGEPYDGSRLFRESTFDSRRNHVFDFPYNDSENKISVLDNKIKIVLVLIHRLTQVLSLHPIALQLLHPLLVLPDRLLQLSSLHPPAKLILLGVSQLLTSTKISSHGKRLLDLSLSHSVFDLELENTEKFDSRKKSHLQPGIGMAAKQRDVFCRSAFICSTDLFKLVSKFLWVHLHRRQRAFILCQIKYLNGIRKHGAHLLFFISGTFTSLNRDRQKEREDDHKTDLPSLWAAPPSVTVLTKIPNFSNPMSAPAPIPMMLIPNPSLSVQKDINFLFGVISDTTHGTNRKRSLLLGPFQTGNILLVLFSIVAPPPQSLHFSDTFPQLHIANTFNLSDDSESECDDLIIFSFFILIQLTSPRVLPNPTVCTDFHQLVSPGDDAVQISSVSLAAWKILKMVH